MVPSDLPIRCFRLEGSGITLTGRPPEAVAEPVIPCVPPSRRVRRRVRIVGFGLLSCLAVLAWTLIGVQNEFRLARRMDSLGWSFTGERAPEPILDWLSAKGNFGTLIATGFRRPPPFQKVTLTSWAHYKDSRLQILHRLPDLKTLDIEIAAWSDHKMEQLAGLKKLEELNIIDCDVTDEGLRTLKKLPRLKSVRLHSPHLTKSAIKQLFADLPQIESGDVEIAKP